MTRSSTSDFPLTVRSTADGHRHLVIGENKHTYYPPVFPEPTEVTLYVPACEPDITGIAGRPMRKPVTCPRCLSRIRRSPTP